MSSAVDADAVGELAGRVADLVRMLASPASDVARVEALAALEGIKALAGATQARVAAGLDASVRAHHEELGLPAGQRGRGVGAQVGLARRESPARGARFLGLAKALTTELPHTLAAMETGVLSEWRATLIARETACLDPADRASVDRQLCTRADEGYRFEGWGDRRLVAETQKLVYAIDPHAVVNRRARAEADRRVTLRPMPDTMAQLTGLLPAAQGIAAWAALTQAAETARAAGDPRTRGQVMADTLIARITGQTVAEEVRVEVDLVVSDQTLFADGQTPGWLRDYGPVPPDHARTLAGHAITAGLATLRRLYAHPDTGQLVAMDSTARRFPTGLARFLDLRDQACRTSYCDAQIRHHDHITTHANGGETSAINGQGTCEACNYTKQAPGWRTRPITGPPGTPHTVETTTPTGHTHLSTAPGLPPPAPLHLIGRARIVTHRLTNRHAA